MGKKRTISRKSIAGKAGHRPLFSSKPAKVFLAVMVIGVVASFIPAVNNQVESLNKGYESSKVRRQIEEQKAERRRLIALKAEALSPEEISRNATKLGFTRMSARNIKGFDAPENSALQRAERDENPAIDRISSGFLTSEGVNPDIVLISDRSQNKNRR
jgi:cell division protein FtsL